ncbi:MAG: Asp-tRNA(Asn)/Glu-tRNA(Gln) amidotransferase subunit GatB [Fuerstiella sp.]|nr:Asp-tRNA(Asn)/Glu-tRNA(Gln) amidotransferase subunit GatB [Fuerstiella sp.]
MTQYKTIIGLEVHVQLRTRSKLFCGCSPRFNPDEPNTQTCPVCLGLPGALPVMNRGAFDLALRTAVALNCRIAEFTKWDRKQYYYPDLPKAYQISQFDLPFSSNGWLDISADEEGAEQRRIRITRAHLEEDAGKNVHDETGRGGDSRVDLNRTGTPLLEIVSEPDLRTASESRRYLEQLRTLLKFIDVSDCNMQEGSLRCDANVNLHVDEDNGETIATPIVELKNMNSFRNVELAVEYEIKRQKKQWEKTHQTIDDAPKCTRGWDAERGTTFGQREKEDSSDYRYFPDPDLIPVVVTAPEVEQVRNSLPENPAARCQRFQSKLGLSEYDANVIIDQGPQFTNWYELVAKVCGDAKTAANWATQDILRDLNTSGVSITEFSITGEILGALLTFVVNDRITTKSAREIYGLLKNRSQAGESISVSDVKSLAAKREVVSDAGALSKAVSAAIEAMPGAAADVRSGKQAAVGPLIGMVMKQISGADPKAVRSLLLDSLRTDN